MKKALIVQGGWQGHEPKPVAEILAAALAKRGIQAEIADTLDAFADLAKLKIYDLLVPHWTMGEIKNEQAKPLMQAVQEGVGLAGIHGGMGDAFRQCTAFQHMVGGQFVAHPGGAGVTYEVSIVDQEHPITRGLKAFSVTSEQYYMHVDPGNHVLAVTCFGRVVTLDSPRARPPGSFNWQSTLWHEMAHVYSLQLSNQRVPRWLTEGISVYEEGRARPEWTGETEFLFVQAYAAGKT
ncbi:MAG TPA: ThuA domain-containing protein, partial [Candidatus Brocadiia bacterium]|nr:ThuA domain-containing protein [Candidatus Brocadiia bacterium]